MKAAFSNSRGMTLILALFVILIISVLIVGLLLQSRSSRVGAHLHVEALRVRQLGESAMNLVNTRIQESTQTTGGQTWASQPGAIWNFGSTGNLLQIHKLYSALNETAATAVDLTADLPPADWANLSNEWVNLNAPYQKGAQLHFPIVDPRLFSGNAGSDPEGFSYTDAVAGTILPAGIPGDTQRLPMPVRWLYVLSDGRFVSPTAQADGTVLIPGAGPGAEIVGRVAFWSDDETSKVNLNTAAGGAYWDTPRINSEYEQSLALSQPVQGEHQRYPGHPATVDLRTIFPWFSLDELYDFVPKIRTGGSNGGAVETSAITKPPAIIPDNDRLFASRGEALYRTDRTRFAATSGHADAFAQRVVRGDFLLTASSRSPEVNLFGRPRIAIWPLAEAGVDRSPLDRLIAMCSSIRSNDQTKAYYFQRGVASSPTRDYTDIERNRELLAYLRKATSEPIPGFGGSFQTKYGGPVRDQILTEIFDYVRGATNLKDPLGKKFADPMPYDASNHTATMLEPGEGQVTPIRISAWGTKGFGRFITVSEAFLWMTWQGQGENTSTPAVDADPALAPAMPLPASAPGPDEVQIQTVFALQFIGQAVGYSEYSPNITVKVEGLNQLTLNGANMGFPASGSVKLETLGDVPMGAIEDFRAMVRDKRFSRNETEAARFPFYSDILKVPRTGQSSIAAATGPIIVSIYAGDGTDDANLIQKISLQLPEARFTAPLKPALKSDGTVTPRLWGTGSASDRFTKNKSRTRDYYMDVNDRTRSLVPTSGDHRLTAALAEVPSSFFMAHQGANGNTPAAWISNTAHVSSLQTPLAYNGYGPLALSTGRLDSGATYSAGVARPVVGTQVQGKPAAAVAWDWDTGIAARADGAYINKPDEGSLGRTSAGKGSYFGGSETGLESLDETMFLPNRQISSPGMFGSLPTGIDPTNPTGSTPWQTLQLRPDPASHPGNATPPDHLLLDLFWMPVVEPYAISEPFSTAGKVNMNSRIVPFSYITRETALRAVLKNEKLLALDPGKVRDYKHYSNTSTVSRLSLDLNETLKGFRERFNTGKLFVSPTEISSLYLVPEGQTLTGMVPFWQSHSLTGDNVREKPYANLLAKLTTKSNVYSVHVVAQSLQKRLGNNLDRFGEKGDRVTAEWRGTFLIERFLDPNDTRLPDFASPDSLTNWNDPKYQADRYYQSRVIQVREWR